MRALIRYQEPAYAALRIVSGAMFTCHGLQKLFGVLGGQALHFSGTPQMWIGGLIELICGIAIATGLFTRYAAFLASGTMAVAFFQFHFAGDFHAAHWVPVVNKGELAVLYCFVFLFFFFRGPGQASLDRVFKLDQ
jgi:putative oxidoreductase